jgi:hypothetical protein
MDARISLTTAALLLFGGLLVSQTAAAPSPSANGTGARFGTRDPKSCPDRKAPERGAISGQQAAIYIVCGQKGDSPKTVSDGAARTGDYLYLLENVKVEVAKGRPFKPIDASNIGEGDIDTAQPLYQLQGTYTEYQCTGTASDVKGKNCNVWDISNAKGVCYKDTFSNWNCVLGGGEQGEIKHNAPGPH